MTEVAGSPLPNSNGTGDGKNQRTPAAAQGSQKRNNRNRRNQTQSLPQLDGTLSDNVTNPAPSPRSKKQPKQKQSAAAPVPNQNGNMGKSNCQKPRPVSMAGTMPPATPAKEQAYAGPTFHASPAPSSLPVPKFLSKSMPKTAGQPSLQARLEAEKAEGKKEESSPEPDVVAPVPRDAQQSPLDFFFQADKAEKQKTRSGSHLLSPQMVARQPPSTEPRNPFAQSGRSIFLQELNGDGENMPSPRTVPPQSRPPLNDRARSSPGSVTPSSHDEHDRDAYTKSLKDLLFNNGGSPQNPAPPQQPRSQSDSQGFHAPSPFNRPSSGPATPAPTSAQQQQQQQNQYSLHYGNRNLSPLFKASRETPVRPSGLRQEVPNSHTPTVEAQQGPRDNAHIDPNAFSRDYLNQHIKSGHTGSLPHLPFLSGSNGNVSSSSFSGSSGAQSSQHGVQAGGPVQDASPRSSGSKDIRSMEDDLRRMLKLNVMG